jgi:hypothetical protein
MLERSNSLASGGSMECSKRFKVSMDWYNGETIELLWIHMPLLS